jgi:hypothetical protein
MTDPPGSGMQRNGSRSSLWSSLGIIGVVASAIGAVSTILGFIDSSGAYTRFLRRSGVGDSRATLASFPAGHLRWGYYSFSRD